MIEGWREEVRDRVLMALRRIMRAVELHSRQLSQEHGLTGPQALILRLVVRHERVSGVELARMAHLSKATISGILVRLEAKGLIQRNRSSTDRRRQEIEATARGREIFWAGAPPLLQESFVNGFEGLPEGERFQILEALERIVGLMGAQNLEASPVLATGPLDDRPVPAPLLALGRE